MHSPVLVLHVFYYFYNCLVQRPGASVNDSHVLVSLAGKAGEGAASSFSGLHLHLGADGWGTLWPSTGAAGGGKMPVTSMFVCTLLS